MSFFGNMDFGKMMGAIQNNSRRAGFGTQQQQEQAQPQQSVWGAFTGNANQEPFFKTQGGGNAGRITMSPQMPASSARNVAFRRTPYGDQPGTMANRSSYFDMADQMGYRVPDFTSGNPTRYEKKHPHATSGGAIDNPTGGGTSYRDAFQYFGGQPQQPQTQQTPSWLERLMTEQGFR